MTCRSCGSGSRTSTSGSGGETRRSRSAGYEAALAGDDPSDLYLILLDGRRVGMIQTYLVADHPEWEAIVQVGQGVAGVDLLIGEPELVGQGLGPRVLAEFVRTRRLREPGDARLRRDRRGGEQPLLARVREGGLPPRPRRRGGDDGVGVPHRLMRLDRETLEA